MHGGLSVLAALVFSTDVFSITGEVTNKLIEYKARRKLYRLNHGLFLHVNADISDVVRVFVSGRTLLCYT